MSKPLYLLPAIVGLSSACVTTASGAIVTQFSGASDASPYLNTATGFPPNVPLPTSGGNGVNTVTGNSLSAGNPGGTQQGNAVFVFQLPSVGAVPTPFTSASLAAAISGVANGTALNFNGGNQYDLYGLPSRASATVLASDFYIGGNDASATKIQDNFATNGNNNPAVGTVYSTSLAGSTTLAAYLNAQYAVGLGANRFVFLRVNPDFVPQSFGGASFFSGEAAIDANKPTLTYDLVTVPEPTAAALLGGLAPLALRRRRGR